MAITAIEGSLTLTNMKVDISGLDAYLEVSISPAEVDVIPSGPLYLLDQLSASQVRVYIDLTGRGAGTYQLAPSITLNNKDIRVESMLPGTIEVTIIEITPTPTPVNNLPFSDGFESGLGNWTKTSGWTRISSDKHSGSYSVKGDSLAQTETLVLKTPLVLSGAAAPQLTNWTKLG